LIVQLVTESTMLCVVGGALGLLMANWGLDLIRGGMPAEIERYIPGWKEIHLDGRTLAFTLAAAVVSGILAGLVPSWQCTRPDLGEALKEGARGSSAGRARHRLRTVLVGAEIALSVVLLIGASLMVRGFSNLMGGNNHMDPSTFLTMRLSITQNRYPENHQVNAFYRAAVDRVAALPGVQATVAVTAIPYSQHSNSRLFTMEGRPPTSGDQPWAMFQAVSGPYFRTLHIPLRTGRLLSDSDGADTPLVAVVSERFVRRWFPSEPWPIGKHIRLGAPESRGPWITIVGVVGDVVHSIWDRGPRPTLYVPFAQSPQRWMDIGVRTAGDPLRLVPAVTAAIRSVDSAVPITQMRTMEISMRREATGLTYVAVMMGIFGVLALVLSVVGVYGVMAYLVAQQTHDIGIRVALGASHQSVLAMIFRHGLLTTFEGLFVGMAAAYGLARLLASLIFGVTTQDPVTFAAIPLALIASAALAIYIPARRAIRIDPLAALRYE
jgi:putative ABC transport system permease protein